MVFIVERNFSQLVDENTSWIYKFIRSIVKSDYAAEEITQDTFYLAYKNFSGYSDYGKERAWLKAIARNAARKYYNKENKSFYVSLDADDSDIYYNTLASEELLPDEKIIHDELIDDILRLIAALPEQQKLIVTYRYINNLSIAETSDITGLPAGTVKSGAYYGIKNIREQLGINEKTKTINNKKGAIIMKKCVDYYGLLFEYAKGYLTKDERDEITEHIENCADCAKIINGLKALWPYLQKELYEDDDNYFSIAFQVDEDNLLTYTGFSNIFPKKWVEELNETLSNNGNKFPAGHEISFGGHDADLKHLSEYCNEGGKVEFELRENPKFQNNVRCFYKAMSRVYEKHWQYAVHLSNRQWVKQSKDAPNLYTGFHCNGLGKASKCGLFVYIYDGATNIRIKKGSGVLELDGGVKFAYSQRFTTEEERIDLSFTFNM